MQEAGDQAAGQGEGEEGEWFHLRIRTGEEVTTWKREAHGRTVPEVSVALESAFRLMRVETDEPAGRL
jgi:hypothetical protein